MAQEGFTSTTLGLPRSAAASGPGDVNAKSTHTGGEPRGTLRVFFEEVGRYYLPWIVAAAAVAVILWQQHTTMELIERINARYLQQLATVMEALERVNMTLETEGYTLLPLGAAQASR